VLLAWDAAAVRAAEEPLLAAGVPLMDRAAFALSVTVARGLRERRGRVGGARVVLLVGPGNNGGDTLFAGARLAGRGAAVTALLAGGRAHDEGLAALRGAGGRALVVRPAGAVPVDEDEIDTADAAALAARADVVLDGLLGIGARGGVRGVAHDLVAALAGLQRRPFVVAVDVPSGIGVDDGTVPGDVLPADLVVTFGGAKAGLLLPPAAGLVGRLQVVDLGLSLPPDRAVVARLGAADIAAAWPVPTVNDHKYSRGVLGVVAGTRAYPGAATLVCGAAVRAGVGMVRHLGDVGAAVVAAHPEVVAGEGEVQAWTLGPGVDAHDEAQAARIAAALATGLPAVVDAGALPELPERVGPHVVLTPHAGELVRLLAARGVAVERDEVAAAPLAFARRAHELTGATVLLKGAVTVVVGPGVAYAQAEAPAWLATAGAGDVLAGLLGALLAGRSSDVLADPSRAALLAAVAASVHGRAAHLANPGGPVSASAVADALPATVAALVG
jgi:hydroxyethylthiazole kinase-like uncharacterized protein yjeF